MEPLKVMPFEQLQIRTDSDFFVWEYIPGSDSDEERLLGPDSVDMRTFTVVASRFDRFIRIECSGVVQVDRVLLPNPLDDVDPVPMEVPLALQEPETMREIISRYVREENMRIASEQDVHYVESEDEAEDFDVEDEATEFISEEEFREMQEDKEKSLTGSKDSFNVEAPTAEVKDEHGNLDSGTEGAGVADVGKGVGKAGSSAGGSGGGETPAVGR